MTKKKLKKLVAECSLKLSGIRVHNNSVCVYVTGDGSTSKLLGLLCDEGDIRDNFSVTHGKLPSSNMW